MSRAWLTTTAGVALTVLAATSCGSEAASSVSTTSTAAPAAVDTSGENGSPAPAPVTPSETVTPSTTEPVVEPEDAPEPTDEPEAAVEAAPELEPALDERTAAENSVTAWLSATTPADVSRGEIACVAAGIVAGFEDARLGLLAPLRDDAVSALPGAEMTEQERGLVLDGVVGCLPWTHLMRSMFTAEPGFPAGPRDCVLGHAATDETDRLAASAMLFGSDLITVFNDLVPPECLPAAVAGKAETPAGYLIVAQLMEAGVSAESAGCVAAAIEAQTPDPAGDEPSEQQVEQAFAAIFGCLTPEEIDLLNGLGGELPEGWENDPELG